MPLALFVFFISGAVALLYQVVWMRDLTLILGATTYGTATILATFMGGLSIGSIYFGRRADTLERPLVAYALLELGIGAYVLITPFLFEFMRIPYIAFYRLDPPFAALILSRVVLASAVLLLPTVLMGGTLPILATYLVRRNPNVGRQISILYFVNTAGAVIGCVLAGFFLIEHFGLLLSTRIGVVVNWILAALAIGLHMMKPLPPVSHDAASPVAAARAAATTPAVRMIVLAAIGVSGFTALAYEVIWTRALLRYLYNSTYAFTAMLAVFLLGLAIGSLIYTWIAQRKVRPVIVFAVLEVGVGIGFAASLLMFEQLGPLSNAIVGDMRTSFGDSMLMLAVRSALILLVPAICLGATVPVATEIFVSNLTQTGTAVGRVYGVNTVGAILGSIGAAFVLIPGLGMQHALMLLITINLLISATLFISESRSTRGRVVTVVTIATLLIAGGLLMPADIFKRTFISEEGDRLVFYSEGITDTVGVVERDGQREIVYDDKRGTAATWSYSWNFVLGHLPVLIHPGNPKEALHICFGVGNSLSALAAHESIERVDNVELSSQILKSGPHFWTNNNVLENPKINTIFDDGRNYVMATDKTYDIIMLEPPETYSAGVINLYTREFYADVRERLNDDGLAVQWIPIGASPLEDEKMLFRAFYDVFPNGTVWQLLAQDGNILLVGTKEPLFIDYQLLTRKYNEPRVRRDLELSKVRDPIDILGMFVFDSAALREFVRGIEPVVDDRTRLDFSMPRHIGSGFGLGSFTTEVKEGERYPLTAVRERALKYDSLRELVTPYLTGVTAGERRTIDRTLRTRKLLLNRDVRIHTPREDWNRWPDF
jgi:spermidine synthase